MLPAPGTCAAGSLQARKRTSSPAEPRHLCAHASARHRRAWLPACAPRRSWPPAARACGAERHRKDAGVYCYGVILTATACNCNCIHACQQRRAICNLRAPTVAAASGSGPSPEAGHQELLAGHHDAAGGARHGRWAVDRGSAVKLVAGTRRSFCSSVRPPGASSPR